jgi:hypothetical protein
MKQKERKSKDKSTGSGDIISSGLQSNATSAYFGPIFTREDPRNSKKKVTIQ